MRNGKKVAESATFAVWAFVVVGFFSVLGIDVAGDQEWLSEENAKMLTKLVAAGLVATLALLALVRRIAEREEGARIEAGTPQAEEH